MPRQPETLRKALGILLLIMLLATVVLLPANPDVMAADLGWSTPKNISNNPGLSVSPRIAADGSGNLYVVWKDSTTGNNGILCSTRPSSGNWSTPQQIPGTSGSSTSPSIAVDHEGRLHVAWKDNITEPGIFYANRTSSGNWSDPQKITGSSGNSTAPDIAIDGLGNPHVVWEEDLVWEETPEYTVPDIMYATKSNETDWSTPVDISDNSGYSRSPSIAIDSAGNVHVVWEDDSITGIKDILYATKSVSVNGSWSPSLQVISNSEGQSSEASIAVDTDGNPHVVWQETSYNANMTVRDIRIKYATRTGDNWFEPENILPTPTTSDQPFDTVDPSIAIDPTGKPQVVWQDNILHKGGLPLWSIGYAIRQDNGGWSNWFDISQSSSDSTKASIAIDAWGNPHWVWQSPVGTSNYDIFYATLLASPPDQPTNTSPEDGDTGVRLTPTLEASAFSDPEESDALYASQWQLSTSSGNFTNPVFDEVITSNSTRVSIPSDVLEYETTYYWRVGYQDSHGTWSSYSNETSFTTTTSTPIINEHSSWLTGRVIGAIVGGVIVVLAVVLWLVFRRHRPVPA